MKKVLLKGLGILALSLFLLCGCSQNKVINKYSVRFDSNGGTEVKSQIVEEDTCAKSPTDPVKVGYKFLYWELEGRKFNFSTTILEDITLKAVWENLVEDEENNVDEPEEETDPNAKKYTVTFNTDGGSSISKVQVVENSTLKKPTNPTKKGYKFVEWQLDGETFSFSTKITKNITLKAIWQEAKKFTVTFNSDGGTSVSTQTVEEEKLATKPSNPTKTGYKFKEWQLDGKTFDFNTKITDNITLKAVWEEIKKYTVTFNSNGGTNVSAQTVEEEKLAFKPVNPVKSGYRFVEWQLNGRTYDFNSKVTGNITLNAVWEEIKKYTVTFNSNGGTNVSAQTVEENKIATKPANPTKDGYVFKEWQLNGVAYNFSSKVTGNITLNATWTQRYTLQIKKVDEYSPDRYITVYDNGTAITISELMYSDGVKLPASINGTQITVSNADIEGETTFKVKLTNGTVVTIKAN